MSELHAELLSTSQFGADRQERIPQEFFELDRPVEFLARVRTFGEMSAARFFTEIKHIGQPDDDGALMIELKILHTDPSKDVDADLLISNSYWSPLSHEEPALPPIGSVVLRAMNGYMKEPDETSDAKLQELMNYRMMTLDSHTERHHGGTRTEWGLKMNPNIRPHFTGGPQSSFCDF